MADVAQGLYTAACLIAANLLCLHRTLCSECKGTTKLQQSCFVCTLGFHWFVLFIGHVINIHSHCTIHHAFSCHLHKFLLYLGYSFICWQVSIFLDIAYLLWHSLCWLWVSASNCFGTSSRNSCAFLISACVSQRHTRKTCVRLHKTEPCNSSTLNHPYLCADTSVSSLFFSSLSQLSNSRAKLMFFIFAPMTVDSYQFNEIIWLTDSKV